MNEWITHRLDGEALERLAGEGVMAGDPGDRPAEERR
jgi:hypothetical protein